MTSFEEIVAAAAYLQPGDASYLRRLVSEWGLIADLCFADLVLFTAAPTLGGTSGGTSSGTSGGTPETPQRFVVSAQVRPTTSQTLYQDDLVGDLVLVERRPLLADSWRNSAIIDGHTNALGTAQPARIQCIPVRRNGRTIAILSREWALDTARRPGQLERMYLGCYDRLAAMVVDGRFPFMFADEPDHDSPRVGDGSIVLDADRRVAFASPNAVSALHRVGTYLNVDGRSMAELGLGATAVDRAFEAKLPSVVEFERPGAGTELVSRFVLILRVIPLIENDRTIGALLLLRDVSDLRRRDQLLSTKDAQVREVHHRVKNNLQTISALLRLQGRRMLSDEAKEAIEESVRRIRSIALVHETLSREGSDVVPFGQIVRPLVRMVEEGLGSGERPVHFTVEGECGDLDPEVATPLAVVLTELLQNSVDHGLQNTGGEVKIELHNSGTELKVRVSDNGVGLPPGFSPTTSTSLGLTIVRSLVANEMNGAIAFHNDNGAVVELRIPIRPSRLAP